MSHSLPLAAGPVPFSTCVSNVLGTVRVAVIWHFVLFRLVGVIHSLSAAHNSCPMVHGVTAVLTVCVTLDQTRSLGSGVSTALWFKSWLIHRPAAESWDTFPVDPSVFVLSGKQVWGLPLQGFAQVPFVPSMSMVGIREPCPVPLGGHITSISLCGHGGRNK